MLVVWHVTLVKEALFSDVKHGVLACELCFHVLPLEGSIIAIFFLLLSTQPFIHNGDISDYEATVDTFLQGVRSREGYQLGRIECSGHPCIGDSSPGFLLWTEYLCTLKIHMLKL